MAAVFFSSAIFAANAAPVLNFQTTSWDTIGLDSNGSSPTPAVFPVMVNIMNTGNQAASNVVVQLALLTGSTLITNADSTNFVMDAPIPAGGMAMAHFLIGISTVQSGGKYSAAQTNASRDYQFHVTGSNISTTNASGGTLVCQKLVSQNRNTVDGFILTNTLQVASGQIVNFSMLGKTSAQYDDCEPMIPFPNTLVHILTMNQLFQLPGGIIVTNQTYQTNAGKVFTNNYQIKVVGNAGTTSSNAAVIYDLSNSSYHYNSDFGDPLTIVTVNVITATDLGISKTGPANVYAGTNFTYTITVTNAGPLRATNVVVTDVLPAGLTFVSASGNGANTSGTVTWNLGILTTNVATNLTVTVTAPASGSITNTASVTSSTINVDTAGGVSLPVVTTVTPAANLAIGKTAPASILAASNLTYNISVTNLGPSTASAVVVTDAIPVGATFVSASGGGVNNSGVVNWSLGNLISGQTSNLTLTVIAPANGTLTNFAVVSSPTLDTNLINNTTPPVITTVMLVADVAVSKSGPANVFAGTNFNYTLTITNDGPSVSSNVIASDTLPLNVTFVSASGGGTLTFGTVIWSLGDLAAGATTNLTLTVTAPGSGTISNTASVTSLTSDINLANNTSPQVTTTVTPLADVAIGKSGPAGVTFNTNFDYTISVTNFGPSTATSLSVTDDLPVGLIFVSASPSAATNGSGQVIWTNIGDLAANTTTNLTLTVISTLETTVTNVASAGSPTLDPTPANNATPPVITTITNAPPVANPDNYSVTENSANNSLSPLDNDVVQTPGGTLTIIEVDATNGAATTDGTNILFTPDVNFIGTATIGYTITDNVGGTNSSLITITVTNIPPLANPDSDSASENSANDSLSPLINDSVQTPGGSLTIIAVNPTNGTATISGTNVLFTPATSFIGTATIGYTITDNIGGTNSSLITVTVTNRPPLANPDNVTAPENVSVTLSPLTNDVVQTPGGTLTIISVNPTNGTASIVDTNILFTPATNFIGTATVGYTIIDNVGGTNSAVITIVVASTPPTANAQSVSVFENTATAIALTGSDANSFPLTFVIVNNPTNGVLSNLNTNSGAVTYTPNNNYTGADSFTFYVNNGLTNSAPATVTISVLPAADIAVFKTGPTNGIAGLNLTYTVTVTNLGPSSATNVVAFDQLPAGFTFVSASPAAIVSSNLVTWPAVGVLAKNAKTNFTVTVVSAEGGNLTNIAFATATTIDSNTNNNNGTSTNSQTVTFVTPLADVAVFKAGTTSVAANGTANYTITVTNSGPSTATNVVVNDTLPGTVTFQSASGGYSLSNNIVIWSLSSLATGSSTTFTVSATAPASGSFVNIASSTSDTADSNTNNNNGTAAGSKVTTSVVPVADVQVSVFGPTNVTAGDGFFYTVIVSNAGPSTAANISITNRLPTNIVFQSATGGGTYFNSLVKWPILTSLAAGGSTNLTINVTPSTLGSTNLISGTGNKFNFIETNTTSIFGILTNTASAFGTTFDPNLTNNSASSAYTNAQVQTVIVPGVFSIFLATNTYPTNVVVTNTIIPLGGNLFVVGTSAFNPQTQLYEEFVSVTNLGLVDVHALRLYVGGLRSGVRLYNATGTNNGVPYVEYDPPYNAPLHPFPAAGNNVTFALEFFVSDRKPFTNSLTAVAINPPTVAPPNGTPVTILQSGFTDTRNPDNVRFLVEFTSIPGRTYTIEYGDDLGSITNIAVPSIVASATTTFWYDDGPPETISKPISGSTTRYYRVLLNP